MEKFDPIEAGGKQYGAGAIRNVAGHIRAFVAFNQKQATGKLGPQIKEAIETAAALLMAVAENTRATKLLDPFIVLLELLRRHWRTCGIACRRDRENRSSCNGTLTETSSLWLQSFSTKYGLM